MICRLIRFPLQCVGSVAVSFWQMRAQNKLLASMWATPDSATVAAGADSALTHPPVSADRPSSPNPRGAAGSHHELVDLIAEMLDAHEGHWNRDAAMYECLERVNDADRGFRLVMVGDDYQGWLRHVAPLIAERIEKASPAVDLTFDDLTVAAALIRSYALRIETSGGVTGGMHGVADRLAAAAAVAPATP